MGGVRNIKVVLRHHSVLVGMARSYNIWPNWLLLPFIRRTDTYFQHPSRQLFFFAMFWQLSLLFCSILAPVAIGAPLCYDRDCSSELNVTRQKRQMQSLEVFVTETQMVVFSQTETETITDVFTTTEVSSVNESSTPPTSTSSPSDSIVRPEAQFVGVVPDPASDAATVLFLPITNSLTLLSSPSLATTSAEQTSSPDSDTLTIGTTTTSDSVTPATSTPDSSSDTVSTADSSSPTPTLLIPTESISPSVTDSTTTETDSSVDPSASPAFALHQPTVSGPLVSAYYPDWVSSTLPPESIDMTRFDWIDFAFVTPDQKFNLAFDDPSSSPNILKRVVSAAHAKGTKVKVSIGGWGGSKCVKFFVIFFTS